MATIQYKDLIQKLNISKFGSIFILNMLSAILDGNLCRKSTKIVATTPLFNMETCNQNQTPGGLGESSI